MRPQIRTLLSRPVERNLLASLLCVLLVLMASQMVLAQSGRGARRSSGSVAPSGSSSGASQSSLSPQIEATRLSLLITDYQEGNLVAAGEPAVRDGFMDRLKEAAGVAFKVERDVKRKDALLRAKSEKESYVVWLRIESDALEPALGAKNESRLDDLVVNYVVFAPMTGEVKAEGRVYCRCPLQSAGIAVGSTQPTRKVRLPSKTSGPPTEQRLERIGREAASRVLAAFGILLPSTR